MKKHDFERLTAAAAIVAMLAIAGCASGGGATPTLVAGPNAERPATKTLTYKVFTAGKTRGFPLNAYAADIAPGANGTMWFTDGGQLSAIGRISSGGTIREFRSGLSAYSKPLRIALGPDGNMWFTDAGSLAIGKVSPSGKITEYVAASNPNGLGAHGLAFGKNGTPWFVTMGGDSVLGSVRASGTVSIEKLPANLAPDGTLAADAEGNLWFFALDQSTEQGVVVERLASGKLKAYKTHLFHGAQPCCPNVAPSRLTIGPDGNPWFTTQDFSSNTDSANFFGTVRSGKVVLFKFKDQDAGFPSGVAAGKTLWFTGGNPFALQGGLWNVGPDGSRQVVYDLSFNPMGLTLDSAGNPWFTATFNSTPSQIVEVIVK
ncbi:MAG TPA: hypothetical protein VK760_16250 [Candidatus Acidoferrales bacterium]|jgi:virginiamycin B lyase|nr:hypothetical protein [Candidatus Acidoferrales bacterium]